MSDLHSKFRIIALGEMQQPSAVGATGPEAEPANPALDDHNFDSMNEASDDEAWAMQVWVNIAVDKLNEGKPEDVVLAEIAHDGCPDPETVLQKALAQPTDEMQPVGNGEDPIVPFVEEQPGDGEGQSLEFQPPATPTTLSRYEGEDDDPTHGGDMCAACGGKIRGGACRECGRKLEASDKKREASMKRVKIAGTALTGVEIERWEDMWGDSTVKIALDGGGTLDVAPSVVEPYEGLEEQKHPLTKIQDFIDSIPIAEPTRPSVKARLANLAKIRQMVRENISKVSTFDALELESLDREASIEEVNLRALLVDEAWARSAATNPFQIGTVDGAETPKFQGSPREAGAVWGSEYPEAEGREEAARIHAASLNMDAAQTREFVEFATLMPPFRVTASEDFIPLMPISRTHLESFAHEAMWTITPDPSNPLEFSLTDNEGLGAVVHVYCNEQGNVVAFTTFGANQMGFSSSKQAEEMLRLIGGQFGPIASEHSEEYQSLLALEDPDDPDFADPNDPR